MKKFLAILVALLLVVCSTAFAENAGVVIIPSEDESTAPVSLDDMQIDVPAEVPNYGTLTCLSAGFSDTYDYFNDNDWYDRVSAETKQSGVEADFVMLKLDILNTSTNAINYTEEISNIIITYKDKYQYVGYINQFNYDCVGYNKEDPTTVSRKNGVTCSVDPLYEGHYIILCYVPNAIVNDGKGELKISFSFGENQIIYYVRKQK